MRVRDRVERGKGSRESRERHSRERESRETKGVGRVDRDSVERERE